MSLEQLLTRQKRKSALQSVIEKLKIFGANIEKLRKKG